MKFFSVECEAPGVYGPSAKIVYDSESTHIIAVEYLDLEFQVWLGSELVQHVRHFCVTERLWNFLQENGIRGVAIRDMTVTAGEPYREWNPGREIPLFKELILLHSAKAESRDGWILDGQMIPDADMFTGFFTPLFVSERAKDLLCGYGFDSRIFEEVKGC